LLRDIWRSVAADRRHFAVLSWVFVAVAALFMVARIGFSATTSRESRQGRKAAAAAMMSGAGVSADASHLQRAARATFLGVEATPEELRREDAPVRGTT
jgi:hypothetical protein